MELRHRILEFSGSEKYNALKSELDKLGVKYGIELLGSINGIEHTSIEFWISNDDPLFPVITKLIHKHHFYVQSGLCYNDHDIQDADWLWINAGSYQYPQPEDNYIQSTYDTTNFCEYCGIGKLQNKPIRIKSDFKQNKLDFLGLHWIFDELFIRPGVKDLIEGNQIGDVDYIHPLFDKTGTPIETVYQLKVKFTLAPGLVTKDLDTVTCKANNEEVISLKKSGFQFSKTSSRRNYCNQVKYHYPLTTMITFDKSIFANVPDIVKSNEYFGSGASANRLILFSRRFVNIVEKYKLRGLKYTPIKLV
jgi:hypothetical protein